MTRNSRLFALPILLLVILFTACKKGLIIPETASTVTTPATDTTKTTTPTTPTNPTNPTTPVTTGRIIPLGTGSGNLMVDGTTLGIKCNDVIKIKGGVYSSITIKNINVGCDVTVQNDGLVEITGNNDHMFLSNVSNLTISGLGTTGISRGFVSRDDPQHRSIIITGAAHDLTIQGFSFKNIGDYVIYFNNAQGVYDGSVGSYSDNIKLLNNDCDNTGVFLQMEGSITNGVIKGLVKHLEIAYLTFTNSNAGHAVQVENADDYNIHHNTITNVNSTNNAHNGIFTMMGSGSFHHNLVRNHQGNAIRAWARSFGTTPKDILIYNNTVVNSRKYSGFEVQSFSYYMVGGKTTYANAKVYNNICGDLNLSKDWVGVVVDIYSLEGGKCEVYNNTGFNFPSQSNTSNIVNVQADITPIVTNNKYYASANEAGISNIQDLKMQP